MKINKVEHFSVEELIKRLMGVTMLKDRDVKPYENADIKIMNMDINNLYPAQRYVLEKELKKVRDLKWALQEFGYDIFNLNGFVRLTLDGVEEPIDLLPPVIEQSVENNGQTIDIINDGMHRLYSAYLEWVYPQVIYISLIDGNIPYYAYPIPEKDWTKVELCDKMPSVKKWHRISDNKKLYRDLNSTFKNVGGPRGK